MDNLDQQVLHLIEDDARRKWRAMARSDGTPPEADLRNVIRLPCARCLRPTAEPHWARRGLQRLAFCSPTCRDARKPL